MTTTDSTALVVAAQQRAQNTRRRAVEALRRCDAAGETVTFTSVARAASVSRSWLYRQPDLRAEIDRLRGTAATATIPSAQRASTDSLRRRLEATLDEIQRLKAENHQLREELARRFGQQRADGLPGTPVGDMSSTWTPRSTRR
jgi:Family of unknown function (DUF6262)